MTGERDTSVGLIQDVCIQCRKNHRWKWDFEDDIRWEKECCVVCPTEECGYQTEHVLVGGKPIVNIKEL